MKKIISVVVLIMMVFMLEFNLLEPILPGIHIWVETGLSFCLLIILVLWNDLLKTK